MDDLHSETSADAPLVANGDATPSRPAHLVDPPPSRPPAEPSRRWRWLLPAVLVPLVLVIVLVIAWTVDTSASEVPRNVELAGVEIGGLTEDQLAGRIGDVAADFAATPVELHAGDVTYTTTAGDIGLMVDVEDTASTAMEVGDDVFFLARPFAWATSLFRTREAPLALEVNAEQAATAVVALEGEARTAPIEPTVELVDGALQVVPGVDGVGIDPADVARRLPEAAQAAAADGADAISLDVTVGPIPPLGSDEAAIEAAGEAEELVSRPLQAASPSGARTITPEQMRPWVRLASTSDGAVVVTLDPDAVNATLRRAFADVDGHPVDATFTLEGGVPVVRADVPGLVCCAEGAPDAVLAALRSDARTAEVALVVGAAPFTAADAAAYGIKQPVGGNNAWRSGAPTTAAPGFTTYHDAGGARVTNIHRMADLVRGAVIPPGGSFSINDHVGERTAEKGFVSAGAIRDGLHVEEIGGGVSQFATTMFNAAYFVGLQIDTSQAHSEYFDRYPRGREATMGFPAPDLAFTNNTPYGIMIWTSYTDTSLTVTLYSTPYANAAQTAIVESPSGNCTVVTTTRTITYPDGHTASDKFRATYRPGEGSAADVSDELRYESRMSDSDALMWTIEKDPLLRSTITAVSLLDGPLDADRFRHKVERASRTIPRLRQRVVGNPYSLAPPRWEVDPNFDLGYHLRAISAGGEGREQDVLELAQWVGMQGFDRARPLWEMYIVEGMADGRSALIQKLHHAITDGVGSIQIALSLFDLERDPGDAGALPDAPDAQVLGSVDRLVDAASYVSRRQAGSAQRSIGAVAGNLRGVLGDPLGSARQLTAAVGSVGRLLAPATQQLSPIMAGRSLSVRFATLVRPLDDLRAAAKAAEGKLNDAFVAAVAGGLQRYHAAQGAPVEALRMTMPINIRTEETQGVAGNQFVPARFAVPMTIDDPVERMAAIRSLVATQRGEPALALTQPLAAVLNRLPTAVTTGVFGGMLRGVDFVTSNVPGAPIPLFAAGAEIVQQFPFGPLSGAAANVTLLSWRDQVCIGINVDPASVTDPEAFQTCLAEGFDEVIAVG